MPYSLWDIVPKGPGGKEGKAGGGVLATKIRCSLYPFFLQWIFSGKSRALKVAFKK
jgi:hypothetical protein